MTSDSFPGRLLRAETFTKLLSARAAATPDAPMLIDASGQRLSFKDVKDCSERTAASLAAQGIGLGTRVAWQLPTARAGRRGRVGVLHLGLERAAQGRQAH